jgi:hypothetical protein
VLGLSDYHKRQKKQTSSLFLLDEMKESWNENKLREMVLIFLFYFYLFLIEKGENISIP